MRSETEARKAVLFDGFFSFGSEWDSLQYTVSDPASPAYRATFYVKEGETLSARLAEVEAKFKEGARR